MGYVSGSELTFLRVVYPPCIGYICQRFCGRHTHYIEYALRRSRLPVDRKHAQYIEYISRQFPGPYFVKYTHYTGYVVRLFCALTLHLISQNMPRILSIFHKKQDILIYPIYRVCLRSLRAFFTSTYTLYTEYIHEHFCCIFRGPDACRSAVHPPKPTQKADALC